MWSWVNFFAKKQQLFFRHPLLLEQLFKKQGKGTADHMMPSDYLFSSFSSFASSSSSPPPVSPGRIVVIRKLVSRCVHASLYEGLSVRPSVRLSIHPLVHNAFFLNRGNSPHSTGLCPLSEQLPKNDGFSVKIFNYDSSSGQIQNTALG